MTNIKDIGTPPLRVGVSNDPSLSEPNRTRVKSEDAAERSDSPSSGAVRIDPSFGSGATPEPVSRVASLKEQVAKGAYNPSSEDVAAAVYKELFT